MPTPASGFSIFSGTSADFQLAIVTATSGLDVVTVPSPLPSPTSLLEGAKTDIVDTAPGAEFVGFGSPSDGLGVLGKIRLRGGISDWSVTVTGANNGDSGAGASTWARLKRGQYVYFHVILQKTSGYGWRGCFGKVERFSGGADTNSTDASPAVIEIKGIGILPDPTFSP